jgi:hypothetical protein
VANVLFHIPEDEKYDLALRNLARHLAPGGAVCTTEYLPEASFRTNMMMVRSRAEFDERCRLAGLETFGVRASHFFFSHPFGVLDPRQSRDLMIAYENLHGVLSKVEEPARTGLLNLFAHLERTTLDYLSTRLDHHQMPGQKLVLLRRRIEATTK